MDTNTPAEDVIDAVIDAAGGPRELAKRLLVKPPTVYQWRSGARKVSPRLAILISQEFPSLASVHDLRPDVFGPQPADKAQAG